jgi:hypothetical protein
VTNIDYAALYSTATTRGTEFAGKAQDLSFTAAAKSGDVLAIAGTYLIQFLAAIIPWLVYLISWTSVLVPLAAIAYAGYQIYLRAYDYWVEGDPDQYGLLVRNGTLVKQGVGLTTWTLPGDQFVQFPAQIRQCPFSAEQVTLEM